MEQENKDWIIENDDGTYTVKTKTDDIVLKEVNGEEVDKAFKLSETTGKDVPTILLMKSIIDKEKYDDRTILTLPGSTYLKLKAAIVNVYGLKDFL